MIKLIVDNKQLSLRNFWYHYKDETINDHTYQLTISLSETELIKIIEEYAGCVITDENLSRRILKLDKRNKSMGLLWILGAEFEKVETPPLNGEAILWTINNVREITIRSDDVLIITGSINNDPIHFDEERL